jgi:PAS domain S-box-containing protein
VTISRDGKITDVNAATEQATGVPREELIGTDFCDYFTEPEKARRGYQTAFEKGFVQDYALGLQHKSGLVMDVLYNASLFKDEKGNVQGIFAAARDVTEGNRISAALKKTAAELARSNEELAQFAYVASHDLQEPLRKIVAFGERLHTHSRAALDDLGRDYLDRMEDAARRMGQLIESLLDLSRVTTRGQEFQTVDLNEVVAEVLGDLETRIRQTRGRVETEKLPILRADRSQMRQLFQNLIGNALKFHKPDVPPTVMVLCQRAEGGGWEIHVTDNGIGFDEKYLDRIFRPFQRLHSRSEYEGSGMGLAICSKIVARHAGQFTAHSQPGTGSDFVVTLPAMPMAKEAKAS